MTLSINDNLLIFKQIRTLTSYQLFEDRTIQFNFFIENLENSLRNFYIGGRTYLVDNLVKNYFNPITSLPTDREKPVTLIQNYPVEFTVSFSKLQEGIKAVVLQFYLPWSSGNYWQEEDLVSFGPIKLK